MDFTSNKQVMNSCLLCIVMYEICFCSGRLAKSHQPPFKSYAKQLPTNTTEELLMCCQYLNMCVVESLSIYEKNKYYIEVEI